MWVNQFEAMKTGNRSMHFYEPLETNAPECARPYCCYINTVIFYEKPYRVVDGEFARYDQVETQWDLLGQKWTAADIGFASLSPLVWHEGSVYELGGGSVKWRGGKWFMEWLGWRLDAQDMRLAELRRNKILPLETVEER